MSNEKKEEVGVDLEEVKETRTPEQIAKDNRDADHMDLMRDMVHKFFKEAIMPTDISMALIEAQLVQYLKGIIMITRGKSKLWEQAGEAEKKYYECPINKLELHEDLPESKK